MRYRYLALIPALALLAFQAVAATSINSDLQDDLKTDGTGIITHYADMQEGDDIHWYWIAPETRLANYRCQLSTYKNLAHSFDHKLRDVVKEDLPAAIKDACSGKASAPVLQVEVATYHVERANTAKRWIPFAGGHLAQAEVCMEFIFRDPGKVVKAKIRHCAREGHELSDAADEVLSDMNDFVHDH
ncbi:MAG TPA: hypothetical protein VF271_03680 [Rhodanobacteraceae bacterium]